MRTSNAAISFFANILSPLAFPLRPQRRRRAIDGPVQCLVNSEILKRMCLDVWMSKQRGKLVLSSAEEEQLGQLIRALSTPQGLAQRARVVQLAAQGMRDRAIS